MKKNLTQDQKINLWIDELEHTRRAQGINLLGKNNKYCCLGILCLVAKNNGLKLSVETDLTGLTTFNGECAITPLAVKEWIGLKHECGVYKEGKSLVKDNDGERKSFKEIAKIIRENKETLFNLKK